MKSKPGFLFKRDFLPFLLHTIWYMIYSNDQEFDIWSEIVSGRYADSLVTQVPTKDQGFTLLEDNVLGLEWLWSLILVLQSHLIQSV